MAKRKQEPGHIAEDVRLDSALKQLGDVLAEIARTPRADEEAVEKAKRAEEKV
jgi:hypothetical protein